MKKILLIILYLVLPVIIFAQNGGQQNYNDLLRIDYFGYSGGGHVFRIKNLQPCPAIVDYTIWGSATINSINIFAYEEGFVTIYGPQSTAINIRAKTKTLCGAPAPDRGWVETQSSTSVVLTNVFSNIKITPIGLNKIEILFTVSENSFTKNYNVKISYDGVNYRIIKVLFPNGVIQSKTYKLVIDR